MSDCHYIYENIAYLASARGLSQSQLAEKSGISRMTINKIFSSKKVYNAKISTILRLSNVLHYDFVKLIKREKPNPLFFKTVVENEEKQRKAFLENYVDNVKKVMQSRHVDYQNGLSSYPGVTESTISKLLTRQNNNPQLVTLFYISEQLGVTFYKLFEKS